MRTMSSPCIVGDVTTPCVSVVGSFEAGGAVSSSLCHGIVAGSGVEETSKIDEVILVAGVDDK